jgi:ATP-dependent DNA ligase
MRGVLPVEPPLPPMLARASEEIPTGDGWLYEPKWDGFRAIVFREGDRVEIASRNGQPLERYFPELVIALREALPERCVVDGEIVVPGPRGLDWDRLSQRIHPAESRVKRLAAETPAWFVGFDMLAVGDRDLRTERLDARRAELVTAIAAHSEIAITPHTADAEVARDWFARFEGAGLDGVVAKRADQRYAPGERVCIKVKHHRTADCVVGGYRVHKDGAGVGSLLLGLYDESGVLHHVGHTSSFTAKERGELRTMLKPLEGGGGFGEGRTPGGPSRWTGSKDLSWVALTPSLVCEVHFDQLQERRFRHASRLLRWRPDKLPAECTYDQLEPPHPFALADIVELGRRQN